MGKTFLSGLWLLGVVCVAVWAGSQLSLEEELFDFGSVIDGAIVEHTFLLTNAGDASLTIWHVSHTCGCTTYHLPKWELAPGKSVDITVRFNAIGYSDNPQPVIQASTILPKDPFGPYVLVLKGLVNWVGQISALGRYEAQTPSGQLPRECESSPVFARSVLPKSALVNLQVGLLPVEDVQAVLPFLELLKRLFNCRCSSTQIDAKLSY